MRLMLVVLTVLLSGCAASPYAWKDLGDGEGMRGWAGIPLRYSVPVALAAGAAGDALEAQSVQAPVVLPAVPQMVPQQHFYGVVPAGDGSYNVFGH